MFRRNFSLSYVKPSTGFVTLLPKPSRHVSRRNYACSIVVGPTGDAVPRRSHVDFAAQEEAKIQASSSEVAAASASITENTWNTTESVDKVGVNPNSYAKWLCEKYNISRDEYESIGCANLLALDKRKRFAGVGAESGDVDLPDAESVKGRDVDEAALEELQNSVPDEVMKEIYRDDIYLRFSRATLQGDGPVSKSAADGTQSQQAQTLEEAARIEQ